MIARIEIRPSIVDEVAAGLHNRPKSLPSKLFYDAVGSRLFERITRLPEYYLTRSELEILQQHAGELAEAATSRGMSIVELGAGTAAKTATLLAAMAGRPGGVRYLPVDISPAALQQAEQRLQSWQSAIHVQPLVADFSEGFSFLRRVQGRKLVLYLGSSIGNFNRTEAVALLAQVRTELRTGDALLLGTDMVKDPSILLPAYDDAQGVTAAFNRNILRRLNHELGANFNLAAFAHLALWNAERSRIEMHLVSRHAQRVRIAGTGDEFEFAADETIRTENSCKYTLASIHDLLKAAGFSLERTWFDQRHWFALHWAAPEPIKL